MINTLISKAKFSYYNKKLSACKGNTAATWKMLRKIVPYKRTKPKEHFHGDIKDKVEEFNTHFANIGKNMKKYKVLSLETIYFNHIYEIVFLWVLKILDQNQLM